MTDRLPAITSEVLPAGYGDYLLVTCPVGSGRSRRDWRMLIDTGPDECWPSWKKRVAAIPPRVDGTRFIDLFVVSHVDHAPSTARSSIRRSSTR